MILVVMALWLLQAALLAGVGYVAMRRGREIQELKRLMNYNVKVYKRRVALARKLATKEAA